MRTQLRCSCDQIHPGFGSNLRDEIFAEHGLFAHDAYLRMYVKVAAQSAAYLPCP